MTERRLAPLSALTTLTRRPARVTPRLAPTGPRRHRRRPGRRASSTTPSTPTARRVATPASAEQSREELAAGRTAWRGWASTGPSRRSSARWPSCSTCPSWPSRTRSRPISGRSSSGTATRCSSSSSPPGTWTRPRRSSSGSCTCSSAPTSRSPCGTASRPTSRACGGGWRASRRCWPRAARRCCTRPWTPSSTATRRWSPGWPTTSTRSRPRSSAVTRASPGASTSCRRRCWSSSAPRMPLTGILAAITAGFDKYGVDEELRSYLRDVADHVTQVNERVEALPAAAARHPHGQRDAGRAAAERRDPRAHRGVDRAGRGGQEDLGLGGHPVRADPGRHRVRDELRRDAGDALAPGLSVRAAADGEVSVVLYVVFKRRDWI